MRFETAKDAIGTEPLQLRDFLHLATFQLQNEQGGGSYSRSFQTRFFSYVNNNQ